MQRIAVLFLIFCLHCVAQGRVVLIHGFMTDWDSMLPMQKELSCCGLQSCVWEYPSRDYTFQCHASHLVEYLQRIVCECPEEPIHFVTHSTGALILRGALNMEGCPEQAKVGRIVMLAPPNKGSSLARKFKGNPLVKWSVGNQSGKQLMTYQPADVVQCLGSFPENMKILVISGDKGINMFFDNCPNDEWLAVWETTLETPYWGETLHLTHSQLLKSRSSLSMTSNFLLRDFPEETTEEE